MHTDSDIYTQVNILEFPVLNNYVVLLSLKVCFHFVSPTPQHLSSPVSLLNKNPRTLLKSIEMMVSVVAYVSLRSIKNNHVWKFFLHSQFPEMGYISWHLTPLCPLISSEDNTVHAGYYEYWLRKHVWRYALQSCRQRNFTYFYDSLCMQE